MKQIPLLTFAFLLACNGSTDEKQNPTSSEVSSTEIEYTQEDIDDMDIQEILYALPDEGTIIYASEAMEEPIDTFIHAERAAIVEFKEEMVVIRERYYNDDSEGYWVLAYAPKEKFGLANEIKLSLTEILPEDSEAAKWISVEKVTINEYQAAKSNASSMINKRDDVYENEDTLRFSLFNGEDMELVSQPDEEEEYAVYEYIGHNDSAYCFLVEGTYYEWQETAVYSTVDGSEIANIGFTQPKFSPDNQYMIALESNDFETGTVLHLYKYDGASFVPVCKNEWFEYWFTSYGNDGLYWESENTVIAKIMHHTVYYDSYGVEEAWEYIRIRID